MSNPQPFFGSLNDLCNNANSLSKREYLKSFVLVGGTSLALQFGNRISIDLDFFSTSDFKAADILNSLSEDYHIQVVHQTEMALISNINNVKVDFIRFKYPFQFPWIEEGGIQLLDARDIAPMKVDAIAGRGKKKDFYDLYFLLNHFSLPQMLEWYRRMFPHQTIFHVIRSLSWFEDAESDPEPICFDKSLTWPQVKQRIIAEIKKIG